MVHNLSRSTVQNLTMTDRKTQQSLIDGLRRYQEDFDRDFCFRDIIPEISGIISKELLCEISSADRKRQVEVLFAHFIYVKRDVTPFLNILKNSYNWLYKGILNTSNDTLIKYYRKAIVDIPNNNDWNVHRTKYLYEIQSHLKSKEPERKKYLILKGKLGFGKRWLAADACRDFGVISRVNFKIFWLNVSKCCTQELILEKLHRLSAMMQADEDVDIKYSTYSSNTKNQIVHFRNHLRKVLELPKFRECLIVLIGVQDENILKAFDLPCKFLMTTKHIERFDFIPEEQKKVIEINSGFTKEESYELFAKAVKAQKLPEDMTTHVNDFHSRCDGHPFILSVIAKSFQNFNDSERENEREKRAESWISSLDKYVLHDFKEKITMSMIESMRFLKEENQERYKMMVIFTDNRDIPYKVLEKLWGLSPQQTETMILKLFKYSLIEAHVNEQNEKACSLHYIHYHFLLENVPKEKQKEYHEQLISKYEVERVLSERKNLNLEFPKDEYFHYFIPYHWEGADRKDLFKLYLDFEFLEQKIRYTRLTNTLGDLIRFADLISDGKQYLDDYLEELMFFLCNSVQQIFESSAVNLLQLALNSSGVVQAEAKNQIKRFPDRVWMRDIDHGEQTQIVQISSNSQQQIVRFVRPNNNLFCLISLRDHNILLQQIIRDYHDGAQLYQNDTSFKIIELQGFNNNTFLALTEDGKISVYSMKNVPTRRNSLPLTIFVRTSTHQENFIQRISEDITCFVVTNNNTQADLIVGSSQGKIKFYSWKNHKFEENKAMSIKSKVQNLHRLAKIELENENAKKYLFTDGNPSYGIQQLFYEYLMLINRSGGISFIDLRNSSEMGATKEWKQLESPINLHQGKCSLTKRPITLCVAKNKVVQVTHKKIIGDMFIDIEYDDIYETENDHEILSSAMSNDTKYLILGTTKGIFVFDRLEMEVIMRRNISDRVLSLDINFFEDMYYLCSILEDSEQVICLHGFDDKRDDYKKIMPILVGKDLFDIKDKNGLWEMVAVDDKKTIQFRLSSDEFGKPFDQNEVFYNIEKIIYVGDDIVIGCTSGSVYKIIENGSPQQILELESAITYLELIDNVIVASCNTNFVILSVEKSATFTGAVTKAFRYADSQLLLIKKDCTLEIYNTVTFLNRHKTLAKNSVCTAETFHSSFVAIATTMKKVFFWNFDEMSEVQEISFDEKITALAVSPDKTVLAIGLSNGLIEIFDLINVTKVKTLVSANEREGRRRGKEINNLYFSPWVSPNEPLILMSVSHSIIFWDIKSIQNNNSTEPGRKISTTDKLRQSKRFRSPNSPMKTLTPLVTLSNATENLTISESNPWSRKIGPNDRPELLSCIKFIGKSAKKVIFNNDFDRFVTIDNEGYVYYPRLVNNDNTEETDISIDFNGNPLQSQIQ